MQVPGAVASAPGKIILMGEHAVVYGYPAIAVPVMELAATAQIEGIVSGGISITVDDIPNGYAVMALRAIRETADLVLDHFRLPEPDIQIRISSSIPIASGLGSGAAVSAAVGLGLANFLGQHLEPDALSQIVFEVEKLHHGTPSGIDNTVICHRLPVYFATGQVLETLELPAPLHLIIGDTGIRSLTRGTVADVRQGFERDRDKYDSLFEEIGELVRKARQHLESGQIDALGPLMYRNHQLLVEMDVSSHELDVLVEAAMSAGASGAKLSGGGRGGNMIALADADSIASVKAWLLESGASQVIATQVS